jgi:hypothetical protein
MKLVCCQWALLLALVPCGGSLQAQQVQPGAKAASGALHFDFEQPSGDWQMTDPESWRIADGRLQLFRKASSYQPAVRSPLHIAWFTGREFRSFQLDVRIHSTEPDYNHRDACLFFGHQGPTRYYYVHLGKKADPHANQIFIVNDAARVSISKTTTPGTPWDDQWHHVRVKRDAESGNIRVYFDNMDEPVMTASDKTFLSGHIGLGSFDDVAEFDDLSITEQ